MIALHTNHILYSITSRETVRVNGYIDTEKEIGLDENTYGYDDYNIEFTKLVSCLVSISELVISLNTHDLDK